MNARNKFRPLFTLLLFLAFADVARAITTNPTWRPRQIVAANVNLPYHIGADRILAYDHYGEPAIAYVQTAPNYWLMYGRNIPGAGWQSAIADGGNRGLYPSLAFNRREQPVIGYSSVSAKSQIVNTYNGTFWSAEAAGNVDEDLPYTGGWNSVAIDSTGKLGMAYIHAYSSTFSFIKDTDGDGSILDEGAQAVTGATGLYATLVFDRLNRPMIATQDGSLLDLKFSVLEPGFGWITTTVDSAGNTGSHLSLAIDPDNGYPAISYFDATLGDLRYAAWNGVNWSLTTVDSTGIVGSYTSLAFDPRDGNPAISYYDQTNGDLKIAWHNGASWTTQTVDAVGNVGTYTSIAFNPYGDGFPSIAYGDAASTLYFIQDPPAVVPEPQAALLLTLGAAIASLFHRRQLAA